MVLDNEPVQVLLDPHHPKHRRVLALLTEVNRRNLRRAGHFRVVVPTAVRVWFASEFVIEAGWDRTDAAGATANRLARARDHILDRDAANRATQLRADVTVSVVDACVAQAAEASPPPVAIVASEGGDMSGLAATLDGAQVRVVTI